MVRGAPEATEWLTRKLRRGKERDAHVAGEVTRAVAYLERIAIDEHDGAITAHERVAVVDVAHDVADRVHLREGARDVGRHAHDETEIGGRKRALAALRAVQLVHVL